MRRSLALVVAARRLMWPLSWALAFGGSLTLASLSSAGTNDKVTICHFPPGNPANYQTITIGAAALPAHLAHHDFGGPCANDCTLFGSVCDDGNKCTVDTCNADGSCAHSSPTNCDDGKRCTTDSCDPATGDCVYTPLPITTICDDNNACTGPDRCDSTGQCHGAPITGCCTADAACNDGNLCTTDKCNLATHTCSNITKTCTPTDACHKASCAPDDGQCAEAPIDCPDDLNACTADTCNAATGYVCAHPAISCDDGDACTADTCDSITGCQHDPISCDDNDACTTDTCDRATGCANTQITCPTPDPCTPAPACDPQVGCPAPPTTSCPADTECNGTTCVPSGDKTCSFSCVGVNAVFGVPPYATATQCTTSCAGVCANYCENIHMVECASNQCTP